MSMPARPSSPSSPPCRCCGPSVLPRGLCAGRRIQHHLRGAHHLRRLHHKRVQRNLRRVRSRDRQGDAGLPQALSRALSGADALLRAGAPQQQYRRDVGGDRACHAHHRGHGRHLPHARCDRGGVEIFHPRQRRHRACAVRHHPRLYGCRAGDGRRPQRHGVDRPRRPRRFARAGDAQPRLRLSAARLWHQDRSLSRCMPGCPTPMPKVQRRSLPCSQDYCSTSRSTRCSAARCCSPATRRRWRRGR